MTEIEKESEREIDGRFSLGKTQVVLIICVLLVGVLAVSSVWLCAQVAPLQEKKNLLEDEVNSLQTWLDGNITNYETEITSLHNETDWLNSKYDSYVANHHYTDEEYDEVSFSFYYVRPREQKFGVYDLDDEVSGMEWQVPHQEDVFDCSEMSACIEWHLENEGWNVVILAGDAPSGAQEKHAWLLVEVESDQYMPVEATTLEVVWSDNPYFDNYFVYDYAFEDIQEAVAYNESEFDWWNFTPM